ncbi:hypothetical protein KUV73_03980 [Mameliella alba]|nr:hypothetical protein [Mameliella alba]MBY6168485.1 hypothetical protein [Mameliella alba]MBY6173504.1 hypothetical protein [Mameliella alba]
MAPDKETDPTIARLTAENLGLKLVVARLIKELARDYEDPNAFSLTLTTPIRMVIEHSNPANPNERLATTHLSDLADFIEELTLD